MEVCRARARSFHCATTDIPILSEVICVGMAFPIDRPENSESMIDTISSYEYEARIGQQPTKRAYIFNDARMRVCGKKLIWILR